MQERIERPILFTTEMVKAILSDRKTMTRRTTGLEEVNHAPDEWKLFGIELGNTLGKGMVTIAGFESASKKGYIPCPYGKPGDVLWVRESFLDGEDYTCFDPEENDRFVYRADCPTDEISLYRWKPSIHMPKAVARIWIEVTDIRVERLQDITESDAKAEGAKDALSVSELKPLKGLKWIISRPFLAHQFGFLSIWCKVNGQDSWTLNPWVWVVSFKVLSTSGRPAALNGKEVSHA